MNVVVLVPRREDGGRRDQLWEYVQGRWAREHPNWKIREGHHRQGPFNRSKAINRAAKSAGKSWDVAIIADSDSFVGPDQIDAAVAGAYGTGQMWLAYDRFCYLSRAMSDAVMDGFQGMWETGVEWSIPGTCSSMVVVRRDLWEATGGFDEGFVGWMGEDIGASHAFQTFGGGLQRVPGPCWHLWHVPSTENDHTSPNWQANLERTKLYAEASYDTEKMNALLIELGVKSN